MKNKEDGTDEFKATMITDKIVKEEKEKAIVSCTIIQPIEVFNTETNLYLKSCFLTGLRTQHACCMVTPGVPKNFAAQEFCCSQLSGHVGRPAPSPITWRGFSQGHT